MPKRKLDEDKVVPIQQATQPLPKIPNSLILSNLQTFLFTKIPPAIFYYTILSFLDSLKPQSIFTKTCKYSHALFQPFLTDSKNSLNQIVLNNQQERAEEIMQTNPELLYLRRKVIGHRGQEMEGTPWQIALATLNSKMIEKIALRLLELPDGVAQIRQQLGEQFPSNWMGKYNKDNDENESEFNKLKLAVTQARPYGRIFNEDACAEEFENFKKYFINQARETVVKTGIYFNPAFIQLIEDSYVTVPVFAHRIKVTIDKENQFWDKVKDFCLGFLPLCDNKNFELTDFNKRLKDVSNFMPPMLPKKFGAA